ncbi:MAG: hypothetical protein MI748_04150 [Opitutales bacterium]|nr:hypothetical protein [Opitutales bacterium]
MNVLKREGIRKKPLLCSRIPDDRNFTIGIRHDWDVVITSNCVTNIKLNLPV